MQAIRHPMQRPTAALVDMDGTLANIMAVRHYVVIGDGRTEKDFDAFHRASRDSPPNPQALEFCRRHHEAGDIIVVVTARMSRHYQLSKDWLDEYLLPVCPYDGPIMRPDGLLHTDRSVKLRIHRYLARQYNIVAACDDNPAILGLWADLGIPEIEIVPGWEE